MTQEQANSGQIGFTSDLRIAAASWQAGEALGLEADRLIGQSVDRLDQSDSSPLKDALVRTFAEGQATGEVFRCRLRRADGAELTALGRITLESTPEGQLAILRFSIALPSTRSPLSGEAAQARLLQAASHASACGSMEEISAVILDAADELLSAAEGAVYLAEGDRLNRGQGWGPAWRESLPESAEMGQVWALRLGEPHLGRTQAGRPPQLPGARADAWVGAAPMMASGRTLGLLCAMWDDDEAAHAEMPRLVQLANAVKHSLGRLSRQG
jgi:PAS domain-containing protein